MRTLPDRVYALVDPEQVPGAVPEFVAALLDAGARLLQLRVKTGSTGDFVRLARVVKALADRAGAALVVNDRADVARLVDAAGVHLGQSDLPPAAARRLLGPGKIIGLSTHTPAQVAAAIREGHIDYVAFGPVYPTTGKAEADPPQGLEGLRRARACCPLPLVAIGGITTERVAGVLSAGADAVAVIGALLDPRGPAAAFAALRRAATAPPPDPPPPRTPR